METESAKGNTIFFGNSATVGGDVVGGNQNKNTIYDRSEASGDRQVRKLIAQTSSMMEIKQIEQRF